MPWASTQNRHHYSTRVTRVAAPVAAIGLCISPFRFLYSRPAASVVPKILFVVWQVATGADMHFMITVGLRLIVDVIISHDVYPLALAVGRNFDGRPATTRCGGWRKTMVIRHSRIVRILASARACFLIYTPVATTAAARLLHNSFPLLLP